MLAVPGIYRIANPYEQLFVEVDEQKCCYQLTLTAMERDGELSRDGWDESRITEILGPLTRNAALVMVFDWQGQRQ